MVFNLIAALMSGVLGASLAYIVYRLSGRRMPKAVILFVAAFAMVAYSGWNEMSWYTRTAAALPGQFVVVEKGPPVSSPISPWTYLVPRTDKFSVLDLQSVQPLPKSEGRYLAQLHVVERYLGSRKSSVIVDCKTGEQAVITPSTTFDAAGLPTNIAWAAIAPGNGIAERVCPKKAAPAN
ncbi:MAG TPA: hypothetical protein P5114_03300 [Hyphomicrobiaceae bacterium]|nr:hypothetical protein [Hyphomicrobiaceae bacterium]